MKNTILEYVWLDGYATPHLRSKIKVVSNWDGHAPLWNFDGSSTGQATGDESECLLKPVRHYSYDVNHYIILCEVLNCDETPHPTNERANLRKYSDEFKSNQFWWGFEQEYFITNEGHPLGFPRGGFPDPQGLYYCGVGGNQVKGRELVETHLKKCLEMGISITGINAEVAVGQWEFQCFSTDTLKACDDLWVSRYVLYKLAEVYGYDIDISPKPVTGDWNGSGCHTNFSNHMMRHAGDKKYYEDILESLKNRHTLHINEYGENNHQRLTGLHETQHIETFSWGIADRGASIRVPSQTPKDNWCGYLEDRRPAANCDPYKVSKLLGEAVVSVKINNTKPATGCMQTY
tara:strand:- start:8132 stop:9172 length:1041 start_codon:yes stop_codon:yes gene_type:complete